MAWTGWPFEKTIRKTLVFREAVGELESEIKQSFERHKLTMERIANLERVWALEKQRVTDLQRDLNRAFMERVPNAEFVQVTGECERLRFENESLDRELDTVKQALASVPKPTKTKKPVYPTVIENPCMLEAFAPNPKATSRKRTVKPKAKKARKS